MAKRLRTSRAAITFLRPFLVGEQNFHNNLCVFIIILSLRHFLSLRKSLVNLPFLFFIMNLCSENPKGEYSSAKYAMRNYKILKEPLGLKEGTF